MARKATYADMWENSDDDKWHKMKRLSLLKQLQNIMREYPKSVQIFQELVQNADDAKASVMKIKYDHRKIEPEGVLQKFLKSPALCVYNDGVFDDDDWDGITSVCLSHKENKSNTIGKFGQGFKSIFHLTDYPVVVSGEYVLVIDPFREDGEWKMLKLQNLERELVRSGICNCFDLTEGIIRKGNYRGTLFWFPLRQRANILSSSMWSDSKMGELIKCLREDAHLMMLFLKYLKQIELYNWKNEVLQTTELKIDNNLDVFWRNIEKKTFPVSCIVGDAEVTVTDGLKQCRQKWTIVHYYANQKEMSKSLGLLANDKEIGCLPYVGIAYQNFNRRETGRIFNFLPLPANTTVNLPVHINGHFVLNQNRQHLKQSDGRSSDKFDQWNEHLVVELLPNAYVTLVRFLIDDCNRNRNSEKFIRRVYDCLPQGKRYDSLWKKLVQRVYMELLELPVFFSDLGGGRWVHQNEAILCNIYYRTCLPANERDSMTKSVKEILLQLNKPIVDTRENTQQLKAYSIIETINPEKLLGFLKKSPNSILHLPKDRKLELLQYIIQGINKDVRGLQLLPLHNNEFCYFESSTGRNSLVYFANADIVQMFPGLGNKFVSLEIPEPLLEDLEHMAKGNAFQLRIFNHQYIPELLTEVFQKHCRHVKNGKYQPITTYSPLNIDWIKTIWNLIFKHKTPEKHLDCFAQIPLIPQYNENSGQVDAFYTLLGDYILSGYEQQCFRNLPEKVMSILKYHNVQILNCNQVLIDFNLIGNYIKYPIYECIMELCRNKPELKQSIHSYVGIGRDLWFSKETTAIPFGQKEHLTDRLKGILEGYPKDHSIFKELIQNAEDAGALEIHFLYDERNHKTHRLLGETWKLLQGPALCVFNDGCFTDKDLEGIKRLGVGSKGDDRTKTGQFGIGFNSVYHLTDAPCILALGTDSARGGSFCVLDPHCRYAPLAVDGNPGMSMEAQELQKEFSDVFDTFLSTKELKGKQGTWFRFPLRRQGHKKSEISENTIGHEDMLELLELMQNDIQESLLFLLNIKKITISRITAKSEHKIICMVHANNVDDAYDQQIKFQQSTRKFAEEMETLPNAQLSKGIKEFRYKIDIQKNTGPPSRWLIVQTLGFLDEQTISSYLKKSIIKEKHRFLPRGGVAMRLSSGTKTSIRTEGRAFCLLPLPIETGLPCHINGQFAVDTSRNTLWGLEERSSYTTDARREWNIELICKNIAYAYAGCLDFLKTYMLGQYALIVDDYFAYFPLYSSANNVVWKKLVFSVFWLIIQRRLPLYLESSFLGLPELMKFNSYKQIIPKYCDVQWVRWHGSSEFPILVDDLGNQYKNREDLASKIRTLFRIIGMKLIYLPSAVQYSMSEACCCFNEGRNEYFSHQTNHNCICVQRISPDMTIEFLKSPESNLALCFEVNKITETQVKLCLKYCVKTDNLTRLQGVPLLLRNDGILSTFREQNELILSKFFDLLPNSPELFVHTSFLDMYELQTLTFKLLTVSEFKNLLPQSINPSKFKFEGSFQCTKIQSPVSQQWLKSFWEFVDKIDEQQKDSTENPIEELKEWAFLPVSFRKQTYLFPLKFCDKIIDYEDLEIESKPELFSVFKKLELPMPFLQSNVLSKHLPKYRNIGDMLNCVYFWSNLISSNIDMLHPLDCVHLVEYFASGLDSSQTDMIRHLKTLKMFLSYDEHVVSLESSRCCAISCSSSLPTDGLYSLFEQLNLTVLRYYPELWKFYKLVCADIIDVSKLYVLYVLPNFHCLIEQNRLYHLKYIKNNLLDDHEVMAALKSTPFITANSLLRKACDFFNPDILLFAELCEESDFPPLPFRNQTWRNLLINAGLITSATDELLVTFAKRMARSCITENTLKKFLILQRELIRFTHTNYYQNSDFLMTIAAIKFIPVQKNDPKYEQIHESLNTEWRFISFNKSISHDKVKLVWTSADVLPLYAMPSDQETKNILGIVEEPTFDLVKTHIKNICTLQNSYDEEHDNTYKEVMLDIYSYISNQKDKLSDLRNIPLIHSVKHRLFAKSNQVVKNISDADEIVPFLIRAPEEYGAFFGLFRSIGMSDDTSVNTYGRVLAKLHQACGDCTLSPSELLHVQKALYGLMKSLEMLQEPLETLVVNDLYLLTEDNRLQLSTQLYYDCLEIPRSSLKSAHSLCFLADVSCIGMNVAQLQELFALLPERNRPLSIRSIIVEELAIFKEVECSETASRLLTLLTSDSFITVVMRISKRDAPLTGDFTRKDLKSMSARLRRLRITTVSKLVTSLVNKKEEIECTKTEKSCFYDNEREMLYLNDNNMDIDRWIQRNDIELERVLRVVCNGKFKSGSLISVLLQINMFPESIQERLTEVGVPFLEDKLLSRIWFPLPGTLVPEEMYMLLSLPIKPIGINEYAVIPCSIDTDDNDEILQDAAYKFDSTKDDVLDDVISKDISEILCDFQDKDVESSNSKCYLYVIVTDTVYSTSDRLDYYMVNAGKTKDVKVPKNNVFEIRRKSAQMSDDETESDEEDVIYLPQTSTADDLDGNRTDRYARNYQSSGRPNPQRLIGRMWLTQAEYDLKAGVVTLHGIDNEPFEAYNWVCLQSQQAAEKAVKAAQYATDTNLVQRSHSLIANIPNNDHELSPLTRQLESVIGNINALRYPDNFRQTIPAYFYSREDATQALQYTSEIVNYVSRTYFN